MSKEVQHQCKECGVDKLPHNTYTYISTQNGRVYFNSRCKECDNALRTVNKRKQAKLLRLNG